MFGHPKRQRPSPGWRAMQRLGFSRPAQNTGMPNGAAIDLPGLCSIISIDSYGFGTVSGHWSCVMS
jgi:hypothetical protein